MGTTRRINIEIGRQLHTKAKVLSVLNEISMNEYLVAAIRSAVDEEKKDSEVKK
jgi:predicted HicB family RNase H-like nuclease